MKSLNKLALLCTIPFLAGCSMVESVKSWFTKDSSPVSEVSDTNTTSSSDTNENTEPNIIYRSVWGDEYGETIIKNLGVDLPYIANEGFDIVLSKDSFGDPLVCIYVYEYEGHDSLQLVEEYASICADAGYAVEAGTQTSMDENYVITQYTVFYADGWINDVDAVEIQFLEGKHNGKYALGIFAFNYVHYDAHAWPTNVVKKLLGHDVPHIEESGFEYEAMLENDGTESYLYICMDNTWEETEEFYKEVLENNGYLVDDSEYYEYGYFAYPINGYQYMDHAIQFKYSYGYGLEIFIIPMDYSTLK